MQYISYYESPLGKILLAADEIGLIGLWFEGEKYYADILDKKHLEQDTEIINKTKKWLNIYFQGKEPDFTPPLHIIDTEFRQAVWEILRKIPYGNTITYNEIAIQIAKQKGIQKMSARAVGGAVGHNEISIIIPCHRVIGTNKSLTGFSAGIDKKVELLKLEGCNMKEYKNPIKVIN